MIVGFHLDSLALRFQISLQLVFYLIFPTFHAASCNSLQNIDKCSMVMINATTASLHPPYVSAQTSMTTFAFVRLQLNTVTWHSSMLVFVIFWCQYVG